MTKDTLVPRLRGHWLEGKMGTHFLSFCGLGCADTHPFYSPRGVSRPPGSPPITTRCQALCLRSWSPRPRAAHRGCGGPWGLSAGSVVSWLPRGSGVGPCTSHCPHRSHNPSSGKWRPSSCQPRGAAVRNKGMDVERGTLLGVQGALGQHSEVSRQGMQGASGQECQKVCHPRQSVPSPPRTLHQDGLPLGGCP